MPKKFNRAVQIGGHARVINAITIQVLTYDGSGKATLVSGTTVPTGAGYAKGCLFMKTDAATGVKGLYENIGTTTSASFNLIGDVAVGEITLAEGSILVGDSDGVGSAVDASTDAQILVGDGTTVASVAMSGHATIDNAGALTLNLGTSGTPLAHTSEASKAYEVHTTTSSTSGGTSYEYVLFSTELTGIGQVGGRVKAYTKTNVALGGWANAFKAEIDFQTNGKVTGLGSALVAEMTMPGSTPTGGNYGVLEIELNCPASFNAGSLQALSFMYLSAQGATVGEFDDHGFLMNIQGITAGTTQLYQTGNTQAGNVSGSLKIKVLNATHYITLYDAEATTT